MSFRALHYVINSDESFFICNPVKLRKSLILRVLSVTHYIFLLLRPSICIPPKKNEQRKPMTVYHNGIFVSSM